MVNHPNRKRLPATGYLWRAYASEPGAHGARYAITATDVPPPQIGTVEAAPGLVYAESRYGDWACVCEVLAPLTTYTECGETFVGVLQDGKIISAEEIAATHRYRHIQRA